MGEKVNEVEYADGFNRGYWLFNYEPEVALSLMKSEVARHDDFSTGFAEGLQQAQHDKTLEELEQLREGNGKDINEFER